jgi:hypothetical protein
VSKLGNHGIFSHPTWKTKSVFFLSMLVFFSVRFLTLANRHKFHSLSLSHSLSFKFSLLKHKETVISWLLEATLPCITDKNYNCTVLWKFNYKYKSVNAKCRSFSSPFSFLFLFINSFSSGFFRAVQALQLLRHPSWPISQLHLGFSSERILGILCFRSKQAIRCNNYCTLLYA